MEKYIEETSRSVKSRVGKNPVLLLISGGVDSTVAGALLLKIFGGDQVHLMYFDTGLMRKNETAGVCAILEKLGAENIHIVKAEDEFLSALKGKSEPEEKRKIIGDLFISIQEREVARLGLPENYFLAQGSIRADFIESGLADNNRADNNEADNSGTDISRSDKCGAAKKTSAQTNVIKSHHNAASPLVIAKREAGKILEPLAQFYKNEVRELGRFLGLDDEVVNRHPFPGPGLAVRILGEVTKEKCDILREADAIFIDELKNRRSASGKTLYDEIWQAFAVLLPIRSVGMANAERRYGNVVALRAINSSDGMTANVYPFEIRDLLEISSRITSSVKEVGRVTYDISGKPPATIEWE